MQTQPSTAHRAPPTSRPFVYKSNSKATEENLLLLYFLNTALSVVLVSRMVVTSCEAVVQTKPGRLVSATIHQTASPQPRAILPSSTA
eukprot:scaffold1307_cov200-Pinguiococcus_pyrenoidosus.AAC.122